jgi:hypothetical protein
MDPSEPPRPRAPHTSQPSLPVDPSRRPLAPYLEPEPVLSGFMVMEEAEPEARSSSMLPTVLTWLLSILIALGAVWTAPVRADVVAAESERIADVTVYPDRAEVVREASVRLPAGVSTVEFRDIPPCIDADSLRVIGKGVHAILGTVELGERVEDPETPPDLAAATAAVERIRYDLASLDAEESVANAMRDYLSTVKTVTTDKAREKLADGKPDPAAIGSMYELLRARLSEQGREGVARRIRREKLDKEMVTAQQRLASARPAPPLKTRVASVEVETARAGTLTLRLSYFAPGASWRPTYRATLDPATGGVALVSEAVVRQTTGEDWTGVALHLSTAAPARGVTPPVLGSWFLQPARRAAIDRTEKRTSFSDTFAEDLPVQGRNYQNLLGLAPGVQDSSGGGERDFEGASNVDPLTGFFMSNINPDAIDEIERVTVTGEAPSHDPPPAPSVPASVTVVRSSYTVAFDVPGRVEVPGDGHEHRVVLRGEYLTGTLEYRALPSLQAAAYLIALTHAPEGYPLLAGSVRVFTSDAYLGAYVLPETAPGAELRIPFGVDNRIRIERVAIPRDPGSEDARRDRKFARGWRTTIENLSDRPIDLVVEDRLPYAQDRGIDVERGKTMTAGFKGVKDRPGIVEWTVPLAPGEKREIVLDYTVKLDKEILVAGLN